MSRSEDVVAFIGTIYRIRKEVGSESVKYPLDTLIGDEWKQVQCWDDLGYVVSQLVRHGIAADHQAALDLLRDSDPRVQAHGC